MSEQGRFTIHLEQLEDYQINVQFDWKKVADVLMDEPPPLGGTAGPNASRMLAAAAANCLSASLLYCLAKDEPPAHSLKAEATCVIVRNKKSRLRVGGLEVKLTVNDALAQSPRFNRCKDLFEDFCVVSASIREGVPIKVQVANQQGEVLHSSE